MTKLALALLAAVLVSGCVSPESVIRANPLVGEFLAQYPDAEVKATLFSALQSQNIIETIRADCGNPYLEPNDYYRIAIEDEQSGLSVLVWVNWNSQKVACAIKKSSAREEVAFETISKGVYSLFGIRGGAVIKNAEEWNELIKNVSGLEKTKIDFASEMAIAVFQGIANTGGYSIEITGITETKDALEVSVKETEPSAEDIVTQGITSPYHIVKTKKTDKRVVFSEYAIAKQAKELQAIEEANQTIEIPAIPSGPYSTSWPASTPTIGTPTKSEPVNASCASCDDGNKCTFDYCNQYTSYGCRYKTLVPCYNNGVCEKEETALPQGPSCPNLGWVSAVYGSSGSVTIAEEGYSGYEKKINSGTNSDCPAACDDGNSNTSDYFDFDEQQCKHYNCVVATPTPKVEFCGWCGTSCTKTTYDAVCPQVMPPAGYDCQEINGSCTKVATQTITLTPVAATPTKTPTPTRTPTPTSTPTGTATPAASCGYGSNCQFCSSCSSCTSKIDCGWDGSGCSQGSSSCPSGKTEWYWYNCLTNMCTSSTPTSTPTPANTPTNTPANTATPQPSYPRWEQENVSFSPAFLGGNGGSLEASIATQESGSPSIKNVTFTMEKPDGTTEAKTAATTCAVAAHNTYTSKCWKVTFNIPENNETDIKNYRITASNPYITGTPSASLGVPSNLVFAT